MRESTSGEEEGNAVPVMDTDVDCNTDSDSRKVSPAEEQQPAPDKFIVAKLAGKRTTQGYVGVILDRNEDGDWKVDFYRPRNLTEGLSSLLSLMRAV